MQFVHGVSITFTSSKAGSGHKQCRHFEKFFKTYQHKVPVLLILHGTLVAMKILGQERRLVNPPSQVVAGVRTVTTITNRREHARAYSFLSSPSPRPANKSAA